MCKIEQIENVFLWKALFLAVSFVFVALKSNLQQAGGKNASAGRSLRVPFNGE